MPNEKRELSDCFDCGVKPGEIHNPICDMQRCSVCGGQYLTCSCKAHNPAFARWTGIAAGVAEAEHFGVDLNEFDVKYRKIFYVEPTKSPFYEPADEAETK